MRLFFGLDLPANTKLQIDDWCKKVYPTLSSAVPAANFHLTLAFLGECRPTQLETVTALADGISQSLFQIHFNDVGYWPKPGILWLGTLSPPAKLVALADRCRAIAKAEHLQVSKKAYLPHVTLARRQQLSMPAPLLLPDITASFDHFSLFESIAGKTGVRYAVLQSWPLAPF